MHFSHFERTDQIFGLPIDDSTKGGLTQLRELFTVIPCARKEFKRL